MAGKPESMLESKKEKEKKKNLLWCRVAACLPAVKTELQLLIVPKID